MKSLLGFLACLLVLVAGCGEDTKRSVGPSAAKVASSTPETVWTGLKADGKYTTAGSPLAAFIMAAGAGDLAAVKLFVQAGVDKEGQAIVHLAGIGRSRTALHAAARGGHRAVVTYLLGQGASVSSTDGNGDTPLHAAVEAGNLLMVRELVGQGASVDAKNTASETPLHFAVTLGNLLIVKYLEGQGADLTIISTDGLTPWALAKFFGSTAIVTFLDSTTARAFVDSAGAGNLEVVKSLVAAGMPVDTQVAYYDGRDSPSWTALLKAANKGHLAVVEYLIGEEADVDKPVGFFRADGSYINNSYGETALYLAAAGGHTAVAKALLAAGATVDARTYFSYTPLHLAAWNGHLAIVQYLISYGADVNTPTGGTGRTPRYFAEDCIRQDAAMLPDKAARCRLVVAYLDLLLPDDDDDDDDDDADDDE